jgi:hypothetical protein
MSYVARTLYLQSTGRGRLVDDIAEEVLRHQRIYMPWEEDSDTLEAGKELALHVASKRRARLTVVSVDRRSATYHDELSKLPIVTERSGTVEDGGVALAWCPTYKAMEKLRHLKRSVVILVECPPERFEGWARLVGAYNALTGEVMQSGLGEGSQEILKQIVFQGYKGWHNGIAERMTLSCLDDLAAGDGYDRELVLAYARMHRGGDAIERLQKILDKFEAQ